MGRLDLCGGGSPLELVTAEAEDLLVRQTRRAAARVTGGGTLGEPLMHLFERAAVASLREGRGVRGVAEGEQPRLCRLARRIEAAVGEQVSRGGWVEDVSGVARLEPPHPA